MVLCIVALLASVSLKSVGFHGQFYKQNKHERVDVTVGRRSL
jgi:hypothetical protein